MFERGKMTFVGGPCDGETIETWLPPPSKQFVYRSGLKGDYTTFAHRGIGFHLYYRWYDVWRWEGLDTFNVIYGPVVQLVRAPDCRSGSCEFESRQGRLTEDMTELRVYHEEWSNDRQCTKQTDFGTEQSVAAGECPDRRRDTGEGMGGLGPRG